MVTVLEGTGRFTVGGDVFLLSEGETLIKRPRVDGIFYRRHGASF